MIKCSDYFYLKTEVKPKAKYKEQHDKWTKEVYKNAHIYHEFLDKFVLKTLGKPYNFFSINYGCFTQETIQEFLAIWHGIHYWPTDKIIIPKKYPTLIEWCKENAPEGFKELKRFPTIYLQHMERQTFYFTEKSSQFSKENIFERHPGKFGEQVVLTIDDKPILE